MKEIEDYIAALPDERRVVFEKLRRLVRTTTPEAVEVFGYGMPGFKYHAKPLIYFASFKNHMSFFAMGYAQIDRYRSELADYEVKAGTIHFQPTKPLPDALLKKMIRERMADIDAGGAVSRAALVAKRAAKTSKKPAK